MSQNTLRDASIDSTDAPARDTLTVRYRRSALAGDYLRGGAGALIAGLPLILVDVHWLPGIALGAVLAVFGAFLLRTMARQATAVTVDTDGIRVSGLRNQSLAWSNLTGLSVKYFSTKRDRSEGWMTLRLDGTNTTIKLESGLDDFDHVLTIAASAARKNNVVINDVTRANLSALAIDIGDREGDSNATGNGLNVDGWDWNAVSDDHKRQR